MFAVLYTDSTPLFIHSPRLRSLPPPRQSAATSGFADTPELKPRSYPSFQRLHHPHPSTHPFHIVLVPGGTHHALSISHPQSFLIPLLVGGVPVEGFRYGCSSSTRRRSRSQRGEASSGWELMLHFLTVSETLKVPHCCPLLSLSKRPFPDPSCALSASQSHTIQFSCSAGWS